MHKLYKNAVIFYIQVVVMNNDYLFKVIVHLYMYNQIIYSFLYYKY